MEFSAIEPRECSLQPRAVHLRRDVGWGGRNGIHKSAGESVDAGTEDGKVGVETHLHELKAIGWTRRANWKVKVVTIAKELIRDHVESGRQYEPPNAKPSKLPAHDVPPRCSAAADADVREHRPAPHNQSVVIAINIPHFRSVCGVDNVAHEL